MRLNLDQQFLIGLGALAVVLLLILWGVLENPEQLPIPL
jgi:hypothetical protein